MFKLSPTILLSVSLCLVLSCSTSYRAQQLQYNDYRVDSRQPADSGLLFMLQPYAEKLRGNMNEVVGLAAMDLEKRLPGGSLGNFMADAVHAMAAEKFGRVVDVAMVNFGGIRLNQIPAGEITRGKVFELMPFDNLLVLQELKGTILQQLLDHIAARGGWPVAGMTMQIADKKAVNVLIGGKPLVADEVYVVANSDFVANGGDRAEMLKAVPQINMGYLVRDALLDYMHRYYKDGRAIEASSENRITHAQPEKVH